MKSPKLLGLFLILICTGSTTAQLRLNISGDAEIQGRLNVSSGGNNMFIGEEAGLSNTIGTFNTFIGQFAGAANTSGESNTYIGLFSGFSQQIGLENTYVGTSSGLANSSGSRNTFVGMEAGRNSANNLNTLIGYRAGYNNSGSQNTFVGAWAGEETAVSANTFIGSQAGRANTTGHNNTFIGVSAGILNETGDNLIAIGYEANPSLVDNTPIEDAFVIGNDALVLQSHSGVLGHIGTQNLGGYVNWGTASDGRMKTGVQEDINGLDFILQLRPVSYQIDALQLDRFVRRVMEEVRAGKEDLSAEEKSRISERRQIYEGYLREKSTIRYTGFIAQEVERAAEQANFEFSGVVKPDHDQDHYSLRYAEFVVPLVKGMQEQQKIIAEQQAAIEALEEKIKGTDQLKQEVAELKSLVEKLVADDQEEDTEGSSYVLPLEQKAMLAQNRPNPFDQNTIIDYYIPEDVTDAKIRVTAADGKELGVVHILEAGPGQVTIRTRAFPAGTYFYSLVLDGQVFETKSMVRTR